MRRPGLWGMAPAPWRVPADGRSIVALLPLLIVFYAFLFLPPETEFIIFGVRMFGYRLGVVVGAVPALWLTVRHARGFTNAVDMAIILMTAWMLLSFIVIYGPEDGLIRGAGVVIDYPVAYFVARSCVNTPNDLRRFLILCLPGLTVAGFFLTVESISGHLIYRPFFASIFGHVSQFHTGDVTGVLILEEEKRLGLVRAYGPFDHPILGGTIMVGLLPLYYFSGIRGWPLFLGVAVALTGMFCMSSAAFLAMFITLGAIALYHALPYIPKLSWWTVVAMLTMLVLVLHLTSNQGIMAILSRITLSPETAWYRTLIWKYGIISVQKHPLFGIGYNNWERISWMVTDSVDAHFLLMAMRHGLVVPVLLIGGMLYGMVTLGRKLKGLTPTDQTFMIGMNIGVIIYLLVGQTVTFFGAGGVVFMSYCAFLASMMTWTNLRVQADRQIALMRMRGALYAQQVASAAVPA